MLYNYSTAFLQRCHGRALLGMSRLPTWKSPSSDMGLGMVAPERAVPLLLWVFTGGGIKMLCLVVLGAGCDRVRLCAFFVFRSYRNVQIWLLFAKH